MRMRGRPVNPEKVTEILASYAVSNNLSQTARETGIPFGTVKNIVDRSRDTIEFKNIQDITRSEFINKATAVITLATNRLIRLLADDDTKISAKDLATISAIYHDKRAIANGDVSAATVGGVVYLPEIK